jgi:5'-nucleotidase
VRRSLVLIAVAGLVSMLAIGPATANAPAKRKVAPLRVMVTNDDGVAGVGLDELVEALRDLPKVKVAVIAPTEDNTGAASKTTPGPLTATDAETLSGYKATAVAGFPADTVVYAFEQEGLKFDLVISGINRGQNIGRGVEFSGTVGAAKTAVALGVPALALSQGSPLKGEVEPPTYDGAVREAIKWVKQHRRALAKAKGKGATVVESINVPTCLTGKVRGLLKDLPIATTGNDFANAADLVNCESTLEDPPDDVTAFNNGFATLSLVPPE